MLEHAEKAGQPHALETSSSALTGSGNGERAAEQVFEYGRTVNHALGYLDQAKRVMVAVRISREDHTFFCLDPAVLGPAIRSYLGTDPMPCEFDAKSAMLVIGNYASIDRAAEGDQ